ncbi:Gfo/Idh/MocA family protein [Haloarcula marina]|uniref:Gfo/Idh/MocA family protein n=1 Tax=Haloarcula marina TaxID=2961574 RepID=UPI0020B66CCF|nr:Gfo/Idh/MocA family oxidoreductase [Halomicroarcula marina]
MTYNIGFIGYQFMSKAHGNALNKLPMFFPDAPETNRHVIVGRTEDALEEAAARLGFENTATDWREILDDVDILYNLTPNSVHPEPSIAALERDIPVLCEKPLAPTLEGAEAMAKAAVESDATAATAFNYRYIPAIQHARALIEAGELGEIRQVRGRYLQDWLADSEAPWSWRNDEEMAGSGALGDLGAHTFDLTRFLVGDHVGEFDRISGQLQTFVDERPVPDTDETRAVTVDDAYTAQVEFESGAVGTFEASRVTGGHKNDHSIAIYGSEGSLRFSLERLNELDVNLDDNRGFETILMTDPDDPYISHWWPPGHVIGWEHTFIHENYEFLRAVDNGDEYHPDFQDGLAVQRILDAVERSAEGGEWITL